MTLEFSTTDKTPETVSADCIIVGVYQDRVLTSSAARLDDQCDGAIKRVVDAGDLTGKAGSSLVLFELAGLNARRVILVGLGKQDKVDASSFSKAVNTAAAELNKLPLERAVSYLTEVDVPGHDMAWKLRTTALAADSHAYRYTATYKPKSTPEPVRVKEFLMHAGGDGHAEAIAQATAIAAGVRFARELANLPPNICNPEWMAAQAGEIARHSDKVKLEVLEVEQMEALGMGSLLAVGRGSDNAPKLIVLQYQGAGADEKPYALVGKGITFDTGGVSLKPGPGMNEMKFDMGGAAGVFGAFLAAIKLKLPLNLVCVVPAVENMPDGRSYRPGDILTSMSGQTIEVLNTDAEGRLILCDALTYVQKFEPRTIIDAATLTGACVVALGKHASGLMTQDESLAQELLAAGNHTLDRAWRLPLWDDYQEQLDSSFADMANIGGKSAGTVTAACFLARFTEGYRWAHLDIAGTAWDEGRKGMATGRPVPLLTQYLIDRCA